MFPQFSNAKKVPRDPGLRDRAFFALWLIGKITNGWKTAIPVEVTLQTKYPSLV